MSLEIGKVCLKIAGRESGRPCVIIKKIDNTFVLVTGPKLLSGIKRRKCNVEHLEALPYTLEIKEDASEEEVISAFEKANLIKKLDLKLPSAAEIKAEREKPEKPREEKPKEKKAKEKRKK